MNVCGGAEMRAEMSSGGKRGGLRHGTAGNSSSRGRWPLNANQDRVALRASAAIHLRDAPTSQRARCTLYIVHRRHPRLPVRRHAVAKHARDLFSASRPFLTLPYNYRSPSTMVRFRCTSAQAQ